MIDPANNRATQMLVYSSWGTYSRALETMFEITLANWGPHCRLLMNNVDEYWLLFFVLYKCIVGFAVVNVIVSVFMQRTFKVTARHEEIMIMEKRSEMQAHIQNLEHLFNVLDESGDSIVTESEFCAMLEEEYVSTWFASLDLDASDHGRLFWQLANEEGKLHLHDFIKAVRRIRGTSKAIDM